MLTRLVDCRRFHSLPRATRVAHPRRRPLLSVYDAVVSTLRIRLRELFEIDLRSLALFRVGLAVSVLVDLGTRAFELEAHYTDAGVLPADLLVALQGRSRNLPRGGEDAERDGQIEAPPLPSGDQRGRD